MQLNKLAQFAFSVIYLAGFSISLTSQAALIPRGNGMVYDDVMHVTWLQDANYAATTGFAPGGYMIWSTASDWAQNNVTVGGFTDWRLPSTAEFQNMFMTANGLNNTHIGLTNSGPFINVQFSATGGYWATNFFMMYSSDGYNAEYYYYNDMQLGWSYQMDGGGAYFAWPVRAGDVPNMIPPVLCPINTTTNKFVITWPTNSVGWTLLSNTNPATTNWVTVNITATIAGTNYQVTLPRTNHAGFFRLTHP